MSSDNGIYILGTKGKRGKREYRVIHAMAIENIYYEPYFERDLPSDKSELNWEQVRALFGQCKVFTDLRIAKGYAECMSESCDILEYGIVFLDHRDIRFPTLSRQAQYEEEMSSGRYQYGERYAAHL